MWFAVLDNKRNEHLVTEQDTAEQALEEYMEKTGVEVQINEDVEVFLLKTDANGQPVFYELERLL